MLGNFELLLSSILWTYDKPLWPEPPRCAAGHPHSLLLSSCILEETLAGTHPFPFLHQWAASSSFKQSVQRQNVDDLGQGKGAQSVGPWFRQLGDQRVIFTSRIKSQLQGTEASEKQGQKTQTVSTTGLLKILRTAVTFCIDFSMSLILFPSPKWLVWRFLGLWTDVWAQKVNHLSLQSYFGDKPKEAQKIEEAVLSRKESRLGFWGRRGKGSGSLEAGLRTRWVHN